MELRLLFHDDSFETFDWCLLDSQGSCIEKDIDSTTLKSIKKYSIESSQVTVFLPQQHISMFAPQLPEKANKQQLNAICYLIEDQLSSEIDSCFFAVTNQQQDKSVPVAVIDFLLLKRLVALCDEEHVNCQSFIPQLYLCPWHENTEVLASIYPITLGYLVRYGLHQGLICDESLLHNSLKLIQANDSTVKSKLHLYGIQNELSENFSEFNIEYHDGGELLLQSFDLQRSINFKQKEFRDKNYQFEVIKKWKWPFSALLLLMALFFINSALNLSLKEQQLHDLISLQNDLLKDYLPDSTFEGNPKRKMIDAILLNKNDSNPQGFIDLMHAYSKVKMNYKGVENSKILYQKSRLVVNLESKTLKEFEAFRTDIGRTDYKVSFDNVSIKPEKVTGRLIMEVD